MAIAVAVVAVAAGCVAVPGDAVHATLDGFDDVVLYVWMDDLGDQIVFHGRLENHRDEPVVLTYGQWPRPWDVDLVDANGTSLPFHNRERFRDHFDEFLGAGGHEDFRFGWNKILYDHANETTSPAPPGDYEFVLAVAVKQIRGNIPVGTIEARLPFAINEAG